jgi:glycolate oxidase
MNNNRLKNELIGIFGEENVFTEKAQRLCYRFGNVVEFRLSPPKFLADFIVRPSTAEQISSLFRLANKHEIPIVPWGGGTDFTGANSPIKGGIVIDMKNLDTVEVNYEERTATAGAGATLLKISQEAEKHGLLFQHHLTIQPSATLGGSIATNSFGFRSGKYRSLRNLILGIEVVMPNGEIIKTKPLSKTSTGYDLISLLMGSEGTLGVITKATVKLIPEPERRVAISYAFNSFEDGFQALKDIHSLIVPEFYSLNELSFLKYTKFSAEFIMKNLDSKFISWYMQMRYIKKNFLGVVLQKAISTLPHIKSIVRYIDNTLEGQNCLSILTVGFEGEEGIVKRKKKIVDKIARASGGFKFEETSEKDRSFVSHLEYFREVIFNQFPEYSKDFRISTFDVAVPLSKVLIAKDLVHQHVERYKNIKLLDIEVFSSLESLDFEVIFPVHEKDSYFKFFDELNTELLKLGCSLSFAHGVGTRFLPYLKADIGGEQVAIMNRIKKALDPKNILNPGKVGDLNEIE